MTELNTFVLKASGKKIRLGIEFVLLFFGIPTFLYFDSTLIHPGTLLVPVFLLLLIYFRRKKSIALRDFIRLNLSGKLIRNNVLVVLFAGFFLSVLVMLTEPEELFNLPRGNLLVWLAMCIFYPVFSAYIQEVVFRLFLFERYGSLFRKRLYIILASGISFSFVHIVYYSPISMILTLIAGLYLAWIYEKTKSVLFTAILHGAFGMLVFTVGLGHHFWLDMYKWL